MRALMRVMMHLVSATICCCCISLPLSSLGFFSPTRFVSFHRNSAKASPPRPVASTLQNNGSGFFFDLNQSPITEEWKTLNRAVSRWEMAAAFPDQNNDSNVFFQLGTALSKRLDFYQRVQTPNSLNITEECDKIVECFERAIHLERRSLEKTDPANLISALRTLGLFYIQMGMQDECLRQIDEMQRLVSLKMPFVIEAQGTANYQSPEFEWINRKIRSSTVDEEQTPVAIRTIGDGVIMDSKVIDTIRASAQRYRERPDKSISSRFTMQYEGNSDIHLIDLCTDDPELHTTMDHVLTTKVYPLVRASFGMEGIGVPASPLCVYDALVVRYDADKAISRGRRGAALPLHYDGGLVSVNIALNSHKTVDGHGEFEGGGTFFDNLIGDNFEIEDAIQRPISPGRAVAHRSMERHAGAMTLSGIREILVFFITARQDPHLPKASHVERAFYLKEMGKQATNRSVRRACYELATKQNPLDSEAHFWLGFCMLSHGDNDDHSQRRGNEIRQGITHLETAVALGPCNAQVFAYLGLAYSIRWNYAHQSGRTDEFPSEEEEMGKSATALKRAVQLEAACAKVGCNEDMDVAAALLTLGEICVRQNKHHEALLYLEQVASKTQGYDNDAREQMRETASSLIEECKKKLDTQQESKSLFGMPIASKE